LTARIIENARLPVKVLATGDVSAAFTVRVDRVSAAARAKIEAAGGSVEELSPREIRTRNRKHRRAGTVASGSGDEPDASGQDEDGSGSKTDESSGSD
jgi:hypothetical protein